MEEDEETFWDCSPVNETEKGFTSRGADMAQSSDNSDYDTDLDAEGEFRVFNTNIAIESHDFK